MNKGMNTIGWGLAAALVLAGCGSSTSSSEPTASAAEPLNTPSDTSPGDFNDADVMFAQMMIPHHEQAIELSDIALDPEVGASDSVRSLAQRIKGAQDPEIDMMQGLLEDWNEPVAMDSAMDHSSMMSGMLTLDELADLSQLRGADFDRAWIEAMIAHHEGAIEMAQVVLDDGVDVELRALAEQIIAGQQEEIEEMQALLG